MKSIETKKGNDEFGYSSWNMVVCLENGEFGEIPFELAYRLSNNPPPDPCDEPLSYCAIDIDGDQLSYSIIEISNGAYGSFVGDVMTINPESISLKILRFFMII